MACSRTPVKTIRSTLGISVEFLEDCDPQDGKPIFKKGSVHKLSRPSANHWITRRKAKQYIESAKKSRVESKVEAVVEEPVIEEAIAEKPADEEPIAEKPADEEVKAEKKKRKKPKYGESIGEIPELIA